MKKFSAFFFDLFERLLALLHVKAVGAGLEVSDEVIRLAYFDGRVWQLDAVRLEPGIVEQGKIQKREDLIAAMKALKTKLGKSMRNKKTNVVVSMSSVVAYTQVFQLPALEGLELEKAVELNLQMASPLEASESYSGWEVVGRDENTLQSQILSSFIEKKVVDEMVDALYDAGFLAMAIESRAIALARVLREKGAGVDVSKPYIFINIDNAGVDFLIIRGGSLYFEYSTPWRDIVDEKGDIPLARFESSFTASVRQVMNFYGQHWKEPLAAVIVSAVALGEEAEKIIAKNASVPAVRLTLVMGQPVSSEWLTTIGCSLRGEGIKAKSHEINLLGENSRDRFHEEQFLGFMRFWRVNVPIVLGILGLTFFVADTFLMNTKAQIEARANLEIGGAKAIELQMLESSSTAFNERLALIQNAEKSLVLNYGAFQKIMGHASSSGISVGHFSFTSFGAPISLAGTASKQDEVIAFKTALENDPAIKGVSLPLTAIQVNGNAVAFTISFMLNAQ